MEEKKRILSTEERQATPLPTVAELKARLAETESSGTRQLVSALFDSGTFSELGVYTMRHFSELAYTEENADLEGVICGYGAVDGRLVYVFAQDPSRKEGAMDEKHAAKIVSLYEAAMKNGAPVVGIFNSTGGDVCEGVSALAAYGRVMHASAKASGHIPQIAVVAGTCTGSAALLAAMFDFTVSVRGASLYVRNEGGHEDNLPMCAFIAKDGEEAVRDARVLLTFLPSSSSDGILQTEPADSVNRSLGRVDFEGDLSRLVRATADNGIAQEFMRSYAPEMFTAFAFLGGVRCGIVGNRFVGEGRPIGIAAARKAARFVSFCDAFSIPVLTFVDTVGFSEDVHSTAAPYASELATLAFAYANAQVPRITVILGSAIGGAFTVFGSKALGADVVFALENAEIGALPTDAAVAFAWNNRVTLVESEEKDTSISTNREELEELWRRSLASPVAAACRGEIDDIITVDEMRKKLLSSLYMLCGKGVCGARRHPVLPL